jgi:type IV secretion system protein VirB4
MIKFSQLKSQNRKIARREIKPNNFIPYLTHYNESTILTKNKDLICCVKLQGFSFETADDSDLEALKQTRNNLLKGFATGQFSVYFHTIRRKHAAYPDGQFDDYFCRLVNDRWHDMHNKEYTFINELYVTIVRKNSRLSEVMTKISRRFTSAGEEVQTDDEVLKEYSSQLDEVRDRVVNALGQYQPKVLCCKETDEINYSEILQFLRMLVNCCEGGKVITPFGHIDEYITQNRLFFGGDFGEMLTGKGKKKYFAVISIKEYRSSTFAGILDNMLNMGCELIITHSLSFIDKNIVLNKIQLQQMRLVQSNDKGTSQIRDINQALDNTMSGMFAFGEHHATVLVVADSKKELNSFASQAVVEFTNVGVTAKRENINLEACFWAQLPGNKQYVVRNAIINTLNVAGMASLHNYPPGKAKDNHWGNAVTVFNTSSGTTYFFSFHVRDVGHTMIVGPTGSGKTVLLSFLCAQAQKFNPRMFFFDKDHGAEVFIRAIGGHYSVLDASVKSNFNPLQLPDTPDNRNFLNEWFGSLVTSNGEKLTAEDIIVIQQAINGNYKLPKNERRLTNVAAFFGTEKPGSIASRLSQWYGLGRRASLFDNDIDNIDFNSARVFGFEMGNILKDKVSLVPTLMYLFHRIQEALDGSPTMVVLDEAWALIDNETFAHKIKDWLKVLRKLNAMVIFATQSIEDATKSSISDTLVQQTATQIFLPNLRATAEYQKVFMLSDREFALIKTTDPASRFFLIKQDSNAVVTRIDLANMPEFIHIFSGRVESSEILARIIDEHGSKPADWIFEFIATMESRRQKKVAIDDESSKK